MRDKLADQRQWRTWLQGSHHPNCIDFCPINWNRDEYIESRAMGTRFQAHHPRAGRRIIRNYTRPLSEWWMLNPMSPLPLILPLKIKIFKNSNDITLNMGGENKYFISNKMVFIGSDIFNREPRIQYIWKEKKKTKVSRYFNEKIVSGWGEKSCIIIIRECHLLYNLLEYSFTGVKVLHHN